MKQFVQYINQFLPKKGHLTRWNLFYLLKKKVCNKPFLCFTLSHFLKLHVTHVLELDLTHSVHTGQSRLGRHTYILTSLSNLTPWSFTVQPDSTFNMHTVTACFVCRAQKFSKKYFKYGSPKRPLTGFT